MKLTRLSVIAILAMSSAIAGGNVEVHVEVTEVTPIVEAVSATTISGKAQAYYYTTDGVDLFDSDSSAFATAVTLDVSHTLFEGVTANFTALGYANLMSEQPFGYFEGEEVGAYFNVANITAKFGDTTFVLGRQLIDSPMFGSFDWLLAPSSFEAYTVVNNSIDNLTLVGTYVTKIRPVNGGDTFIDLTDINSGDNYAFGAVYAKDALSTSAWYYNIDAGDYTQVYVDAGYDFASMNIAAQYAATDYAIGLDSDAYAGKIGSTLGHFDVIAAVSNVTDAPAGMIERDNFYTSSWNILSSQMGVANDDTLSWKVGASTEMSGLNAELSYAGYGDEGSELDIILGYDVSKSINLAAIYSSTDYDINVDTMDAENALELIATYKF